MRIATRASALALAQARLVADLLGGAEIITVATSGDGPRPDSLDKSRWVDGVERALLAGEADLAVHSAKDLPGELSEGLRLLGAPAREPAEDVLCGAESLTELPTGARVATSSPRRRAQLRCARPDLELVEIRGNVDTRLSKLCGEGPGRPHAIVLARAGLRRLGREQEAGGRLDASRFVPSPGQGALALEGRIGDQPARRAAAAITDLDSLHCLLAERALARELGADCHTPLGAHASITAGQMLLRAWIGLPDGSAWLADELRGPPTRMQHTLDRREREDSSPEGQQAERLGRLLADRLRSAGAQAMLQQAREMTQVA